MSAGNPRCPPPKGKFKDPLGKLFKNYSYLKPLNHLTPSLDGHLQ